MFTNPWDKAFRQLFAGGTVVKGIVQKIETFGAFVRLPEEIEGPININNFSWLKSGRFS